MSSSNIYRRRSQSGFTLTELLIGITIIGLLVGMLVVAGSGVLATARETAVVTEMTQMTGSVENFKSTFGFYPPSFEQFKRTVNTGDSAPLNVVRAEASQILPFLNKIAPNHQEAVTPSPIPSRASAGFTRLDDWWEFVGCNLDQSTSLQFWLSGLCHNKQFPLTGGLFPSAGNPNAYIPVGYNVPVFLDGSDVPGGLERQTFFTFDTDRLIPVDILVGSASVINRPTTQYIMDHGKTNGDLFYVYRDADSYTPYAQPTPEALDPNNRTATATPGSAAPPCVGPNFADAPTYRAYLSSNLHRGLAYHYLDGNPRPVFANPNTFQIISFGLDGDAGVPIIGQAPGFPADDTEVRLFRGRIPSQGISSDDNLCNFAVGRLDKYKNDNELE